MKKIFAGFLLVVALASCAPSSAPTAVSTATSAPASSPTFIATSIPISTKTPGVTLETQPITVGTEKISATVLVDPEYTLTIARDAKGTVYKEVNGVWEPIDTTYEHQADNAAFEHEVTGILQLSGTTVNREVLFGSPATDQAKETKATEDRRMFGEWYAWNRAAGNVETRMPEAWENAVKADKVAYTISVYDHTSGLQKGFGIQAKGDFLLSEVNKYNVRVRSGTNTIEIPLENATDMHWGSLNLLLHTDVPSDEAQEAVLDFGDGHFSIIRILYTAGRAQSNDGCTTTATNGVASFGVCRPQQIIPATEWEYLDFNGPPRHPSLTRTELIVMMKKHPDYFQVVVGGIYSIINGSGAAGSLLVQH